MDRPRRARKHVVYAEENEENKPTKKEAAKKQGGRKKKTSDEARPDDSTVSHNNTGVLQVSTIDNMKQEVTVSVSKKSRKGKSSSKKTTKKSTELETTSIVATNKQTDKHISTEGHSPAAKTTKPKSFKKSKKEKHKGKHHNDTCQSESITSDTTAIEQSAKELHIVKFADDTEDDEANIDDDNTGPDTSITIETTTDDSRNVNQVGNETNRQEHPNLDDDICVIDSSFADEANVTLHKQVESSSTVGTPSMVQTEISATGETSIPAAVKSSIPAAGDASVNIVTEDKKEMEAMTQTIQQLLSIVENLTERVTTLEKEKDGMMQYLNLSTETIIESVERINKKMKVLSEIHCKENSIRKTNDSKNMNTVLEGGNTQSKKNNSTDLENDNNLKYFTTFQESDANESYTDQIKIAPVQNLNHTFTKTSHGESPQTSAATGDDIKESDSGLQCSSHCASQQFLEEVAILNQFCLKQKIEIRKLQNYMDKERYTGETSRKTEC